MAQAADTCRCSHQPPSTWGKGEDRAPPAVPHPHPLHKVLHIFRVHFWPPFLLGPGVLWGLVCHHPLGFPVRVQLETLR